MAENDIEALAAARRIVADYYFNIRDPDYAGWVLKGEKDNTPHMQIALTALRSTTLQVRVSENGFQPSLGPITEMRVSVLARAIRASLRSYGHKTAESSLPECIASDVEAALRSTTAEPVAWRFELAKAVDDQGNYYKWGEPVVRDYEPHVPEGSIRNLTPLYAHPTDSAAKDAALKACMNFAADERDRVIKLSEACERFLPKNISLSNSNVPDDLIIPLDVTMGELRNLAAALANRGEAGALAKERGE